jgi:hypothetical protein
MTGYHFLRVVWHAWTYNKSVQNIWDAAYLLPCIPDGGAGKADPA